MVAIRNASGTARPIWPATAVPLSAIAAVGAMIASESAIASTKRSSRRRPGFCSEGCVSVVMKLCTSVAGRLAGGSYRLERRQIWPPARSGRAQTAHRAVLGEAGGGARRRIAGGVRLELAGPVLHADGLLAHMDLAAHRVSSVARAADIPRLGQQLPDLSLLRLARRHIRRIAAAAQRNRAGQQAEGIDAAAAAAAGRARCTHHPKLEPSSHLGNGTGVREPARSVPNSSEPA